MENELTHYRNLANNVGRTTMEENIEGSTPEDVSIDKKAETAEDVVKRRITEKLTEKQQEVKKSWDAILEEKRRKGEEITPEEIELVRKAIEKGEFPRRVGGASDGFESLNEEKYKNTRMEPFVKELIEAGKKGGVTDEFLQSLKNRAQNAVISGNDESYFNQLLEDINGIVTRMQAQEQAAANPQEQQDQESTEGENVTLSIEDLLKGRVEASLKKKENRSSNPRSVQEVALSIINDEGLDRWGPGGTFPLVEEIIENGKIKYRDRKVVDQNGVERSVREPQLRLNETNFLRWFRERMMYHHISNSRDENLALGNLVGITSEFGSTISIFSMDKDRGQYFRDENGGPNGEEVILDKLADQMKNELWLFGNMRNYDLLYQKYMSSDSDLPKFLAQLHDKEEITQPGSLQVIMTLPEVFGETGDTKVGDAIRKAYEIYYHASDIEMLRKALGKDSLFFKKEGFVNAFRIIEKKGPNATFEELDPESQKFINQLFKGDQLDEAAFIKEMNPFNQKNKAEFNKRIIREMVRQVVANKYGLDNGFNPETMKYKEDGSLNTDQRDLVRKDLEYAEAFAWVLTRWTGAAARNDTDAIGFDAFTKTMKTREYRRGQSGINRAAPIGNEYDLGVFKGLTTDFFNGITVEKRIGEKQNYTPFEIFGKMSEIEDDPNLSEEEKNKKKEYWASRLNFEQYIQRSYSADHINRGFEVFHSLMGAEELRIEEIVKWDPLRGIILDRAKFEEQVKEKFLKPIRYAFRTYSQLDLGKTMRMQVGFDEKTKMPLYRDAPMAEVLFGPEVLTEVKHLAYKQYYSDISKGEMTKDEAFSNFLSSQKGKDTVWKRAAMARLAALMKSHRQFGNGYTPFTAGMVETFYDALKTIKEMDIMEGEDDTDLAYKENFFKKEDIEWMRKRSGTTERQLFFKDFLLIGGGTAAAKGIGEGIGVFVKDIFK